MMNLILFEGLILGVFAIFWAVGNEERKNTSFKRGKWYTNNYK